MIPAAFITEWTGRVPWADSAQVEQDLILERAIVEIYGHPLLARELAFRGGTALNKLLLALRLAARRGQGGVTAASASR